MSVIALHLVFTGYGHWLPNDPRGSGSRDIRQEILETLGEIHLGRKRIQPPREVLRSFYRSATPLLRHEPLWFDARARDVVGGSVGEAIALRRYTCWACAVLRNHAHACIRRHRDTDTIIWDQLASQSAGALKNHLGISAERPIWADRPYAVFLETPADIERVVKYIEGNPAKEGLSPQKWGFVQPYDGWPFHKKMHAWTPRKGKPLRETSL